MKNSSFTRQKLWLAIVLWVTLAASAQANEHQSATLLELDVHQAILLGIAKNYGVKINRLNPQFTALNIAIEQGNFEPNVFASYQQSQSERLNSLTQNNRYASTTSSVGLQGIAPWGTRYKLAIEANKNEFSNSANFSSVIEVTQPLLKNFGLESNYSNVVLAQKRTEIERMRFSQQLMLVVQQIVNAYTSLYAAQLNLKVAQANRTLAEKTLEAEQKRVIIGKSSDSATLRPAVSLANREDTVLIAQQELRFRQNTLKSLIADSSAGLLSLELHAVGLPEAEQFNPNITQDFQQALNNRPEYLEAKLSVSQQKIRVKRDQQQHNPNLDLVIRYQKNGLADENNLSSALDNYQNSALNSGYIGINFSMPLSMQSSKSRLSQSNIALQQDELKLEQTAQNILLALDTAAYALAGNWRRLQAANQAVALTQASLDAEEKKMAVGRSNSFYILDMQSRLANAQRRKVDALTSYYISLVNYHKQKGTILSHYQVAVN
ncbi:TolC family protein [Catenovulum agarivorans]|uniref:TolC family protein n=1 Tax=Catenovulum agarivorans TaxID=1172192 RepID=UPI0002E136BB|nr:TolC family protein [Catenovulum agarivorans]